MIRLCVAFVVLVLLATTAYGDVFNMGPSRTSLEMVPIGNPGNAPDTEIMSDGTTGYGSVAYPYLIGKYEVTAGQYTEFLNAVADTDTYGLYNSKMPEIGNGCGIERIGSPGSFSYSVAADWANRPVNRVSWGDAARFSNWLHNGQPTTGAQDLTTTEDGAYVLDGANDDTAMVAVTRQSDATWFIPTENEWYKAAYYDPTDYAPDGSGGVDPGAGYYDYPTGTDSVPSSALIDPDPGNNANLSTIGGPYYRTVVGEFENSASPYGTFDQGGNVRELNETVGSSTTHGLRGGAYSGGGYQQMLASRRYRANLAFETKDVGFRVASIPEPSTITLLAMGAIGLLLYAARRRR